MQDNRARIDLSSYRSKFAFDVRLKRVMWSFVAAVFFRPTPVFMFGWRNNLLRLFGAKIARGAHVYPDCSVWAPWNLEMKEYSCLGPDVDCYCVAKISLGAHSIVSQHTHLCAATHDTSDPTMRLVTKPVIIGDSAWVCAGVFIGPGVSIGEGAVAGAGSVVVKDVPAWTIVGGNPAREIGKRALKQV